MKRAITLGIIFAFTLGSCAAVERVKQRQATSAELQLAAPVQLVYSAALEILPLFSLIATSDYSEGGFIEARGDWGSSNEGAVVQVSTRRLSEATRLVVEAGQSDFESRVQKRELARAIATKIQERLEAPPASR